jgi:hypothetical protein
MKKIISLLAIIMLISLSANAQFCNKYADKAVAQYKLAKKNNLPNIILPFWTDDWNGHYNWCKTVPKDVASKHNELREAYLNKFIKPATTNDKETFCNAYADKAVAQYNLAMKLFNPQGDHWSGDRESIYKWCMKVPKSLADKQQTLRQADINEHSDPAIPGNTTTAENTTKMNFCNAFSDIAIFQYNSALQLQIPNLIPPLWSKDKIFYHNRCMTQSESISNDENLQRQRIIDNFSSTKPKKDEQQDNTVFGIIMDKALEFPDMSQVLTVKINICDHYAKESVRQNKVNLDNDCGFKGNSWSSDYNNHKKWAMYGSNFLKVDKNIADREKQLKKCMGEDLLWITGMVIGLRSINKVDTDPFIPNSKYARYIDNENKPYYLTTDSFLQSFTLIDQNDNTSYTNDHLPSSWFYYTVRDQQNCKYKSAESYKLPPGIIIGLETNSDPTIKVFGVDAFYGPEYLPEAIFKKECGGDLGADKGEGLCWYESTGLGFKDWSQVNNLPRGTVIGLKHSLNQPNKKLIWQGVVFDPVDPNIKPPPGFARKVGGDDGAPAGEGYFWYEKITGK